MLLTAEQRDLGLVGVVDHSSAGNAHALLDAAPAFEVRVLVGLEVESVEGVHLLALFGGAAAATEFEQLIAAHQPPLRNRPDIFGEQFLVNEWGDLIGEEPRLLAVATDLSVEEIADLTLAHDGLSIAAHVDRVANGLLPTLGFVPPRLRVHGLELSRFAAVAESLRRWPELRGQPLLQSSDAHCLADIGGGRTLVAEEVVELEGSAREWGEAMAEYLRGVASRDA
jgi:hypothetical protein